MRDYSDQQTVKKKKQPKPKRNLQINAVSKAQFVLGLVILLVISLFFVKQRLDFIRLEKKVRKLRSQHAELQNEILPLKLEERYLKNFDLIESKAKEKFGLHPPKPSQIKRIVVR